VRYRNDTALDVTVHLDQPVVLPPGAEIEHDVHIIGLTRIDPDPPADTAAGPDAAPPADQPATKATKAKEAGK
jgi:hypothetical protein